MTSKLPPPDIAQDGDGLTSNIFSDIYFQPDDGLAETKHVFLDGNKLQARIEAASPGENFVIGELGLGTGLNLLAAIALFLKAAPAGAKLHLWTCEAYPFSALAFQAHVKRHAARWPELQQAATLLAAAYPAPRPGISQRELGEIGTLTIWFGDAAEGLAQCSFRADAWFLDGFSPAQNPGMWSPGIMQHVYDHTADTGTVATFTVAGSVRRALQEAGFDIEKTKGFGRKREMLRGRRDGKQARPPLSIGIVGAGIAGASAAWFAAKCGHRVIVFDPNGAASGASGNPLGLLMPRVDALDTPAARLYRDAFLFACSFYQSVAPSTFEAMDAALLFRDERDPRRFRKALGNGLWAEGDFDLSPDRLTVAQSATVRPRQAIERMLEFVELRRERVETIQCVDECVQIQTDQEVGPFDHVVLASGPNIAELYPDLEQQIGASRGQIDIFEGAAPPHIKTQGNYVAPMAGKIVSGATYDRLENPCPVQADAESTTKNFEAAQALWPATTGPSIAARASIRATTPDKHPVYGQATEKNDRVTLISGLGSRGLSTGPLLAADLIARLSGLPSPLQRDVAAMLSPRRFANKDRT